MESRFLTETYFDHIYICFLLLTGHGQCIPLNHVGVSYDAHVVDTLKVFRIQPARANKAAMHTSQRFYFQPQHGGFYRSFLILNPFIYMKMDVRDIIYVVILVCKVFLGLVSAG